MTTSSLAGRASRTLTTVSGGSSGDGRGGVSPERRRRRRRRLLLDGRRAAPRRAGRRRHRLVGAVWSVVASARRRPSAASAAALALLDRDRDLDRLDRLVVVGGAASSALVPVVVGVGALGVGIAVGGSSTRPRRRPRRQWSACGRGHGCPGGDAASSRSAGLGAAVSRVVGRRLTVGWSRRRPAACGVAGSSRGLPRHRSSSWLTTSTGSGFGSSGSSAPRRQSSSPPGASRSVSAASAALGAPAGRDAERVRVRRLASRGVGLGSAPSRRGPTRSHPVAGSPAGREPDRVRVRRVVVGRCRIRAEPGRVVGCSRERRPAPAPGTASPVRRLGGPSAMPGRGSGASTADAANGEPIGEAFFVAGAGLLGRRGLGASLAGSAGLAFGAAAVPSSPCSRLVGLLRRGRAALAGAAVGSATRRGSRRQRSSWSSVSAWSSWPARWSSDVVSVVRRVDCSFSSMGGAPVVPRAPGSAPHGDCVKSAGGWFRRRKPVGEDGDLETSGAAAARARLRSARSGAQRIPDIPGLRIERPLREPGHVDRHRRHEVGNDTQAGEDVIRSYGRCDMAYDQVQYRTRRPIGRGHRARQIGVRPTPSRRSTAARASNVRSPDFVIRVTSTASAREKGTRPQPRRRTARRRAARSPSDWPRAGRRAPIPDASTTSSTSRPGGRLSSSAIRSRSGSHGSASPISKYSASLAAPVGAAPA